jgi:hypothetical protein
MTLGEYTMELMRAAGDPTGRAIKVDRAVAHISNAVSYVFGKYDVPTCFVDAINNAGGSDTVAIGDKVRGVYRLNYTDPDGETVEVPRGEKDSGIQTQRWWLDQRTGTVRLAEKAPYGSTFYVYGYNNVREYNGGMSGKDLTHLAFVYGEAIESASSNLQFVPQQLEDVVRYRAVQRMLEDMGNLEKAQYFGSMSVKAEKDGWASYNPPTESVVLQARDLFE